MTELDLGLIKERLRVLLSVDFTDEEYVVLAAGFVQETQALVAEVERLTRLLGPATLPSVDAYENVVQALADERAEVVRHCDRNAGLTALLAEVLSTFPPADFHDHEQRSHWVRRETVAHWRSRLAGSS